MGETYAAAIALEVVRRLAEAGCVLPSVVLFDDCSGRFVIGKADEAKAAAALDECLPDEGGPRMNGCVMFDPNKVSFSFGRHTLMRYREPWPNGGPVPKDHPRRPPPLPDTTNPGAGFRPH